MKPRPLYTCHECGRRTTDPHTDENGEDVCEFCCKVCNPSGRTEENAHGITLPVLILCAVSTASAFAALAALSACLCNAEARQVALVAACAGAVSLVFAILGLSVFCGGAK